MKISHLRQIYLFVCVQEFIDIRGQFQQELIAAVFSRQNSNLRPSEKIFYSVIYLPPIETFGS